LYTLLEAVDFNFLKLEMRLRELNNPMYNDILTAVMDYNDDNMDISLDKE
jgi:hypothetical protein